GASGRVDDDLARTLAPAEWRPVEDAGDLLAEARDDEQPVVDAQPETEHGDDVHDRRVEVEDMAEAPERRQGPGYRGDRPGDGDARGEEAPEDQHHDDEGHGQREPLTDREV